MACVRFLKIYLAKELRFIGYKFFINTKDKNYNVKEIFNLTKKSF